MAINEVWIPSPHYSSSRGPYNVAAFHTTEGAMKIRDLGAWFQNPSAQCSSHHGADNYERGVFGAYVYENHKAWTQASANPWCLSIELCGYASWSRSTWLNSKATLVDNAAEWLNYVCDKHGIPLTLLSNSQAQSGTARGVCQHVNFGSMGSGHHDCGDGFPIDVVLDKAKKWGGGSAPLPEGVSQDMVAVKKWQGQNYYAALNMQGQVWFKQPDSDWFAIDKNQTGAKSGPGLDIDDPGNVTVTFTNKDNAAAKYDRRSGGGDWGFATISPPGWFR